MPQLIILAGSNGAGKTTSAQQLLPNVFGISEFVNADEIARGLSPFDLESVAIQAGRLMLERMDRLLAEGADFAFETTLAAKTYVRLVRRAQASGYYVKLLFFYLPTPQMAIDRVAKRVASGGHNIPNEVVLRRYRAGIHELIYSYIPEVDEWMVNDNRDNAMELVAKGYKNQPAQIVSIGTWKQLLEQCR